MILGGYVFVPYCCKKEPECLKVFFVNLLQLSFYINICNNDHARKRDIKVINSFFTVILFKISRPHNSISYVQFCYIKPYCLHVWKNRHHSKQEDLRIDESNQRIDGSMRGLFEN